MYLIAVANWFADLSAWTLFIWSGRIFGACFIPSVLLQRTARPLAALAWILAILFLPYIGVALWWVMGRNYIRRGTRHRARARSRLADSFKEMEKPVDLKTEVLDNSSPLDEVLASRRLVLRDEFGLFPWTMGNTISAHTDSIDAFDAISEVIEAANDHIHIYFYVWRRDTTGTRFRDQLVEKARQGVEVRILYDAVGSVSMRRKFFAPALEAGAQIASFLPVHLWERRLHVNFRNHRKLLIVDGQYGFTGGINIADEYRDWFDTGYRFEGPVVHQMQEIFAEDWYFTTGDDLAESRYFPQIHDVHRDQKSKDEHREPKPAKYLTDDDAIADATARVVASGPDDRINTIHKMFFLAINSAEHRIHFITPYFVPDSAILTALQTAAMRGIDIQIIVPARTDVPLTQHAGRSYWEDLLEAGIHIYEYKTRVLHAKVLLVDDHWVSLGSANMDIRSFHLNFESNCVIDSPELNRQLSELFQTARAESDQVDLEEFRSRPFKNRLFEGAARLFSPLL